MTNDQRPKPDVAAYAKRVAALAPNEFTLEVLSGAALVLEARDNVLRLNLFAVSIRIFLDHVMDSLAPREQVEACSWFRLLKDQDKPTREQRLSYALHGGFTAKQITDLTEIDAVSYVREVIEAYRELNKHIHGRDDTIVRNLDEQDDIVETVLDALAGFLESYRECRREIIDGIARSLEYKAIEAFTLETVEKLDVMATHHTVDWVGIDERSVVGITAERAEYEVTGAVGVTLLYGSGSDRRHGDGAEIGEEFPITIRFTVPVETPHDLEMAEITSDVDTSAWYE